MTKKHFAAIAAIMARHQDDSYDQPTVASIARELAEYLSQVNPAFDRVRFLAMCWGGA